MSFLRSRLWLGGRCARKNAAPVGEVRPDTKLPLTSAAPVRYCHDTTEAIYWQPGSYLQYWNLDSMASSVG